LEGKSPYPTYLAALKTVVFLNNRASEPHQIKVVPKKLEAYPSS
jgi:hypothetical protein